MDPRLKDTQASKAPKAELRLAALEDPWIGLLLVSRGRSLFVGRNQPMNIQKINAQKSIKGI
jgi:hypothetical protein